MDNWKETSKELPPCDGTYLCANHPYGEREMRSDMGIAFYDGIGFKSGSIYREPRYWSFISDKPKRYGKVDEAFRS